MPFIVKKFEFSDFDNWSAIQKSLLPINKQDASGRRIQHSLLSGLSFNKFSETIQKYGIAFTRKKCLKCKI
jgi:hypothetical protein